MVQIKNEQCLYQSLTYREMLGMNLNWGLGYILSENATFHKKSGFDLLQKYNTFEIADYFMTIKDKIKLEELRF